MSDIGAQTGIGATEAADVGVQFTPGIAPIPGRGLSVGSEVPRVSAGFGAPAALIDPESLGRQVQAQIGFQRVSSLPPYPNSVRLAMLESPLLPDSQAVTSFQFGLEQDILDAQRRAEEQVQRALQTPTTPDTAQSDDFRLRAGTDVSNDMRRLIWGFTGGNLFDVPSVVPGDPSAPVIQAKLDAIERGFLPPDTKLDGSWDPAISNAWFETQTAELGDRLAGNRPGAVSAGSLLDTVDNWLAPTSLLSTAFSTITSDLIPNLGEIADETKGWWGNIKKFASGEDFSLGGLVRALGPIDDIVFPVLNTYMLFTGIGAVTGFARVGWAASRGYAGVRTATTAASMRAAIEGGEILGSVGIQRATGFLDDLVRAQAPGLLSQGAGRVAARSTSSMIGGAAQASSDAMAAWRANVGVQVARRTVGEGMKLGFAGQLEAQINPNRVVGLNPFGSYEQTQEQRILEFKAWRTDNPLAATAAGLFEVGFTPMNVVRPGATKNVLNSAMSALGMEDGLVGRLKANPILQAIPGTGDALEQAPKITMAIDTEIGHMVKNGMFPRHGGRVNASTMERLQDPVDRVAYFFTGRGDELLQGGAARDAVLEQANEQALYFTVSASVDHVARSVANTVADRAADPRRHHSAYLTVRAQMEARIRDLGDLADFDPEDHRKVAALLTHVTGAGADIDLMDPRVALDQKRLLQERVDRWQEALSTGAIGPDDVMPNTVRTVREVFEHHQELRTAAINDVLSYLDEGVIARALNDQWDTFQHWDDYVEAADEIEHNFQAMENGISIRGIQEEMDEDALPWATSIVGEELAGLLPDIDLSKVKVSPIDRALTQLDSGNFTITPGGVHTATRQEATRLYETLKRMISTRDQLGQFAGREGADMGRLVEGLRGLAAENNVPLTGLGKKRITDWLNTEGRRLGLVPQGKDIQNQIDSTVEAALGLRWLARNGYDMEDGLAVLRADLEELNRGEFWAKFRVSQNRHQGQMPVPGKRSMGMGLEPTTIEDKVRELRELRSFLATEVDVPVSGGRYRAVMGDSFLTTRDLRGGGGVLADVKNKHVRRMSLGTFLSRQDDQVVNGLRDVRFRQSLSGRLAEAFFDWDEDAQRWVPTELWDGPANFDPTPGSPHMETLLKDLQSVHGAHAEVTQALRDRAGGIFSQIGARIMDNSKGYNRFELDPTTLRNWLSDERMGEGRWGQKSLEAVIGASRDSRSIGWQYRGLAQLGDRIAREGWTRQAMGVLRYSGASEDLSNQAKWARVAGIGAHSNELDIYRHWKAAGMALAVGLFQGVDATLEGGSVEEIAARSLGGAAAGGALGAASLRLDGPGGIVRTGVRAVGAQSAYEAGGGGLTGAVAGLGVGTLGMGAIRYGATKRHSSMVARGVQQYSRLGDRFERIRNTVRFSLSPVFDIQRYTEGVVLSGATTFKDRNGITRQAPLALKPLERAIEDLSESWAPLSDVTSPAQAKERILQLFGESSRGREWTDALTLMDARVAEKGIMGFSPFEAMAGTWAQVVAAGVDPIDAVDHVKRIYTYGSTARSGFEQSVNFVFFPFSFMKQYTTRLGSFFNEDLGRLMVVHNSLKALEELEETTQFGELVDRHFPAMDQLRKINALAYGFSLGQFGGINRPYLDVLREMPGTSGAVDAVVNAFLPQGLHIESQADVDDWERQMERILPAFRDINDLVEDAYEFGYIVSSPNHQAKAYDRQEGWEAWGALKDEFAQAAASMGVSYQTLRTSPAYASFQAEFSRRERELQRRYPEWKISRDEATMRTAQRQAELRQIRQAPETPAEVALGFFHEVVEGTRTAYGDLDVAEMPSAIQASLRQRAQLLATETPEFLRLYERFYRRDLGPIEMEIL